MSLNHRLKGKMITTINEEKIKSWERTEPPCPSGEHSWTSDGWGWENMGQRKYKLQFYHCTKCGTEKFELWGYSGEQRWGESHGKFFNPQKGSKTVP